MLKKLNIKKSTAIKNTEFFLNIESIFFRGFCMSQEVVAKRIKVSDVVFREDLYPRIETSAQTVQKYAENLEVLPPIEVNQHNELIDGWHRWTAHKKLGLDEIDIVVTQTQSGAHLLELAIMRNATHGLQLSNKDKRDMARRIYLITDERQRDKQKTYLAKILSVTDQNHTQLAF